MIIFTFFYIKRRKHWFRGNFRFPFFIGFIRFGISWILFDYFWKMSVCLCACLCVCVCYKNFVSSVARMQLPKIFYTKHMLLEKILVQFVYTYLTTCCWNSALYVHISDSAAWDLSKFYKEYTYTKRWHWFNFCDYTSLECSTIAFLSKFLWLS